MWQYQAQNTYADEQKYPLGKSATGHSTPFSKLQYRVDATRRAYQRSLKALKELQAEAAAAPAPLAEPAGTLALIRKSLAPNHFTSNWLRSGIPSQAPPQPAPSPDLPPRAPQFGPFPSPAGAVAVSRNFAGSNGLY